MEQNSINPGRENTPEQVSAPAETSPAAEPAPAAAPEAAPEPAKAQAPAPAPAPVQSAPVSGGAQSPKAPKKKNKKAVIAVVSVIAALGLGLGGFGLYKHLSDNDSGGKSKKGGSSGISVSGDKIDLTDYSSLSDDSGASDDGGEEEYDGPEKSVLTQLSLSRDDNGDFQMLSGSFDDKISSEYDAIRFIDAHAKDIGLTSTADEIKLVEETEREGVKYYKFQQMYNDVPVYGNQLIVTVDKDGVIDAVSGGYTAVDVDVDPSIDEDEAEDIAKDYAGEGAEIISDELVIRPHTEDGSAKLVYDVKVAGNDKSAELFIDAEGGDILSENKLYAGAVELLDVDVNDKTYRVELEKATIGGYNLYDPTRDISVSDAGMTSFVTAGVSEGFFGGFNPISAVVTSENPDGSVKLALYPQITALGLLTLPTPGDAFDQAHMLNPKMTEYAVGSLSSLEKAYDYYNTMYGWKSIDGNGLPLKVIVGAKESLAELLNSPTNQTGDELTDALRLLSIILPGYRDEMNACYVKDSNLFVVGAICDQPLVGKGILGHEFTHGVIDNIAHLKADVQPATVNEGYADVIGSVISKDWEFSVHEVPSSWDGYDDNVRSAIVPNDYHAPAIKDSSDPYYKAYPTDEHQNATIISHAAYLMTQKGMSDDEVAGVFFNSMFRLATYTTMERAAIALIKSGHVLSYTKEDQIAIAEALVETKMLDTEGKITIDVHCGNKYIPGAEITINGKKVGKTDDKGELVIDFDPSWVYYPEVTASAEGFDSLTQEAELLGDTEYLDFDLALNKDFGKTHGSDDSKKGDASGETVTVTILDMAADQASGSSQPKAQEYYVQKGGKIDLQKLVDAMNSSADLQAVGVSGITTDGTKIYFNTGIVPVELSYKKYGTNETFDFSQPIYEDVVIEPVVGVGDFGLGDFSMDGQDLNDLASQLDEMFNH